MTQPPQPPEPAVVEWGTERRGVLDRLTGARGWHPAIPWVLAGLGAVAIFGSLVGEWQVVEQRFFEGVEGVEDGSVESQSFGLGLMLVWGMSWLVGAMLLAVCCVLTLAGQPSVRPHTRTVGLAVAAVQLVLLVGAAVNLKQESVFASDPGLPGAQISLGRGVYAAFASVLLVGAALYLARTAPTRPRPQASEPEIGESPADLAVGPAEPVVRPTDTLQG